MDDHGSVFCLYCALALKIGPDMGTSPKLKTNGVEAVDKAFRILALFDLNNVVLSLGEISERSGLVKSSALRLLISLNNAGLVRLTPDKRYAIGAEALRIGRVYQKGFRLEEIVRPVLKKLVARSGESSSFFRRDGNFRICLYREDTNQILREHLREGDAIELGKGAASHVFLELENFDGEMPAGLDVLQELPVVAIGERGAGLVGISAPVFAVGEGMVGALVLSGPEARLTSAKIHQMKSIVLHAAKDLTRTLRSPFYQTLDN